MNEYIVVDASILVARLVAGDVFHQTARNWLEAQRARGTRFLAPALLVVEVAAAISRHTASPDLARRAVTSLKNLPDLRLVEMDRAVVQIATEAAAAWGVRGADAFYIAIAHKLNLPLATLDTDQRARASRILHQVINPVT